MSLRSRMLLRMYGALWHLARPALRRHKRLREDFDQRLLPEDWPFAAETVDKDAAPVPEHAAPVRIWLQAASGGEAWLIHSLAPALAEALQACSVSLHLLCTTYTRQGLDVLEKLAACSVPPGYASFSACYIPLDLPELMRTAVRRAAPDLIVLLETELWPGLLAAASECGVPVLVLNGRMTEKSFRHYAALRFFWREFPPERVLAISPEDASRFVSLFGLGDGVEIMSNIKFDRLRAASADAAGAMESSEAFRTKAGLADSALLAVLASVREEEEDLLLPVIRGLHGLRLDGQPVVLAVAPRHMHRIAAWQDKLAAAGLPFRLRSAPQQAAGDVSDAPVYLWDTFGELQALYAIADSVYVGGSLVPLGGQNFLEPLAQGVRAFVGPSISNFLWIGNGLFELGLVDMVPDAEALRLGLTLRLQERLHAISGHISTRPECCWQSARSKESERVRKEFEKWLDLRVGGSRQAAEAMVSVLRNKGILQCR